MRYKYKAIYQEKTTGDYFSPELIAFTKKDLFTQILNKRLDGHKYVRAVQGVPGTKSILNPMMPDMSLVDGKDPNEE